MGVLLIKQIGSIVIARGGYYCREHEELLMIINVIIATKKIKLCIFYVAQLFSTYL